MKHYDVIDADGEVIYRFEDRKDADIFVFDNQHNQKLEVIEIEITPCSQEISS